MKKSGLQNTKLLVEKQEHSQNLIWKINTDNLASVFKVEVLKGCEVLYHTASVDCEIFDEGSYTIDKQKYIIKDRGALYGIDVTPFEIVCGVYDVSYNDCSYGKDTRVGIYTKCKVYINNAKLLYKKLIDSRCEFLSTEDVKETVCEGLKAQLKLWLSTTLKNVRQNKVDEKCLESIKVLDSDFNRVLTEWGLVVQKDTLTVGQVKFDEAYVKEREDKEKREEQKRTDEENRIHEEMKRRREIDLLNSLQRNAKDDGQENELKAVCPKCKRTFDRGYNTCPYCSITLKK